MTTGADILRAAFADSCQSLGRVLDGVGDEEFFWEPVAGAPGGRRTRYSPG